MIRSVGALLAGLLAGVLLSLATDVALHAIGVFPPWGQPVPSMPSLLATFYRTVYSVVGSYVAARLAPNRRMGHALVLGVMNLIASAVGAVVTWNRGPAFGPHRYPVALIVVAMPAAWAGGMLGIKHLQAREDGAGSGGV